MANTSTVQLTLNTASLLEGLQAMDTNTLADFAQEVNKLLASRKVKALQHQETLLLKSINEGLPQWELEQFEMLRSKSKTILLDEKEQAQLQDLVDQIEQKEAERLEALLHLAHLRGITLQALRQSLGITRN